MKSASALAAGLSLCLSLCLPLALSAEDTKAAEKWIPLFNGKNLDGWTVKIRGYEPGDNFGNTFRVEDGLMTVNYDQYDEFDEKFGHIFYKDSFSHYIIRVEYRFIGEQAKKGPGWAFRNSGIMVHGQSPESMSLDQRFPVSIEVQLLGGRATGKRTTANLCTPGTHVVMDGKLFKPHCIDSSSKTYRGDQWVTVEVEVKGNQIIKHIIDGETVLSYTKPQLDPSDADAQKLIQAGAPLMLEKGTISLQSESHPVQFRKVELRKLAP
ncbi:hypothetical protein Pan153_05590 [Gimesia panareensis]|uniref:3-keto-alpha-glucoside-1,2-lyase/3-keto-2-hydroxy-glucal hydratase domain-containing protein n=1 Tax=Gimesia panareensis TaxID=2527978 RepID=A0A518FI50_9PLAN|nr:DUF1080 domain-containing protein [Gimesia panareensis]QDV15940.1 hypothetical protein Pan153_05590 [Gimesia panareensis]